MTELSREEKAVYERNMLLKGVGEEGQIKLKEGKVLVIGAGGLGSAALLYLAAAGIGNLGIADFDTVDLSNLQRQIIHKYSSVGVLKAKSAEKTLKEFNPNVNIRLYEYKITQENIEDVVKDYDFIIDATDRFEAKFLINSACVKLQKPYCHGGITGFNGQCFTYIPHKGPCLSCLFDEIPKDITSAEIGVLGACVGILGSVQALEAIKYILGIGKLLTGRILTLDGLNSEVRTVKIPNPNPKCKVCSKNSI